MVLPDPENMGIAVGISLLSLLSCIQAEIYVMSFLPVICRHLWFLIYPDIGQYCHMSLRVAQTWKHGYSRWNLVHMLSTSWDISTSGLKDAISDFIPPVRFYNNTDCRKGLLDLGNIVIAVGISFLSCLQAEIKVFPVLEATILDFSLLVE